MIFLFFIIYIQSAVLLAIGGVVYLSGKGARHRRPRNTRGRHRVSRVDPRVAVRMKY